MNTTNISTKTTEAILNLLRTLPVEELDIIIKKTWVFGIYIQLIIVLIQF